MGGDFVEAFEEEVFESCAECVGLEVVAVCPAEGWGVVEVEGWEEGCAC